MVRPFRLSKTTLLSIYIIIIIIIIGWFNYYERLKGTLHAHGEMLSFHYIYVDPCSVATVLEMESFIIVFLIPQVKAAPYQKSTFTESYLQTVKRTPDLTQR
jgi:hypothetical protein